MLNLSDFKSAERVFHFFEEISKIPHGSANTAKIADYLVDFATERKLYVRRDAANNVIIRKPATKDYEDRPTVIFQGHTDMVIAKLPELDKDMECEGLDLYVDGDFLRARGTTLGGDDGVAVAYALAVLDSEDIPHPEFEAIFTSDEEIGLLGAVALDTSDIRGKTMINIDSDSEGILTVGCAGGVRIDIKVPMRVTNSKEKATLIKVSGLAGGHSGIEINSGRENAIKILGEVLSELAKRYSGLAIYGIRGGNADNAIPRSAECLINRAVDDDILSATVAKYKRVEPDISITAESAADSFFYSAEDTGNLISLINEEPCGVIAMSKDISGLVETSLNLGIIESECDFASLAFSLRSAKGAEKDNLATRVTKIAEKHGATHFSHGAYPAWEYRKESHLRDVMCEVYRKMYGKDARVITIHAGLECGIFSDKIDGLDCVSIGPDNYDIHTTEEHLSISSTMRVWEYLKEVLKSI